MSNTNHKQRQKIPVISDVEALAYARRQMSAILDAQTDAGTVDPLATRSLSELDRLIDKDKE